MSKKKTKFEDLPPREKMREFRRHLGVYLTMSAFFFILNAITSPGHWWFYWPMLGWGLGVALQGVNVYHSYREAREDGLDLDDFNRRRAERNRPEPLSRSDRRYSDEDFV